MPIRPGQLITNLVGHMVTPPAVADGTMDAYKAREGIIEAEGTGFKSGGPARRMAGGVVGGVAGGMFNMGAKDIIGGIAGAVLPQ